MGQHLIRQWKMPMKMPVPVLGLEWVRQWVRSLSVTSLRTASLMTKWLMTAMLLVATAEISAPSVHWWWPRWLVVAKRLHELLESTYSRN